MFDSTEQGNHQAASTHLRLSPDKSHSILAKLNFIGIFALLASIAFSMIPFTLAFMFPRPTVSQAFYFELSVINLAILIAVLHVILGVPVRAFRHPLCIPVLLFGFFTLLSCLFSQSPLYSLREGLFPLSCVLLFLLAANRMFSEHDLSKVTWILLGIGVIMALYGILQYYGIDIQLVTRRGELGYEEERKVGKFAVLSLAGHPNFLSAYLGGILLMSIPLVYSKSRRLARIVGLIALCIIAYCIFLSGVRGAWAGLFVAGLILGAGRLLRGPSAKQVRILLACLGGAFILLAVLFSVPNPVVTPRYNVFARVKDKQALLSRAYGYHVASDMLRKHMLTGMGFRGFSSTFWDNVADFQANPENAIYSEILSFIEGTPPGYIHNEYLEIATGMGLGGIASFFLIFALFFTVGMKRLKECNNHRTAMVYAFLMGSVMFYALDSIPSFPLDLPLSGTLFWFLLAVGIPPTSGKSVSGAENKAAGKEQVSLRLPIALTVAAILVFYGVCFFIIPPMSRAMARSYNKTVEASRVQTQASLEQEIRENPANLKAYYDLLQILISQRNVEAADDLHQRFVEAIYHGERYGYWIAHFFLDSTLFELSQGVCRNPQMGLALAYDYGVTVEQMLDEAWSRAEYKSSLPVQSGVLSFIAAQGQEKLAVATRQKLIEEGTFKASDLTTQALFQALRFGEIPADYQRVKDSLTRIGTARDWKVLEGIGKNGILYSKGVVSMALKEGIPAGSSLWIWMQGTPVMNVYPLVEISVGNQAALCYVRGGKSVPYEVRIEHIVPAGHEVRIRFLNDDAFAELKEDRNLAFSDVFVGKQDL